MFQLVEVQREIYGQVAAGIGQFASDGSLLALLALLPMGLVFGAVHALTPGHSKAVLATYVAGSPVGALRALLVSFTLSFTHVTMAVLIAVLSLPLVSIALGSVGRAPALENVSRGLLGLIGVWMLWRALRGGRHHAHEGEAMGFAAGLVPCPLTLFVMTFAISRGVPQAGLAFAAAMMGGVALTLSAVALLATLFRMQAARLLGSYPGLLETASRGLEAIAGTLLVLVAVWTFLA
jgi:nickel/cobalt exporter